MVYIVEKLISSVFNLLFLTTKNTVTVAATADAKLPSVTTVITQGSTDNGSAIQTISCFVRKKKG